MKYHLDTIPVWDAYKEDTECPFCVLENRVETSYVDSFLGGSVMEPDVRIAVNKKGFCPAHNKLLYQAQNRLGLALITHTHTLETIKKMNERISKLQKTAHNSKNSVLKKFNLFNRKSIIGGASLKQSIQSFSDWLRIHHKQCIICDRIDYSLNRYAYTLMHLWEHDKEFQDSFSKSKGLCFSHLPVVLDMAAECLNSTKLAKFLQTLLPLQMENMDRLEKELLWFTQKFDYRNQDKPWGSSKDALPRILQKLTGKYM